MASPRARARSASSVRSPRQMSSHGSGRKASARHSSGPMPAGSPEGSAMRGSLGLVLDVGFVPHAAQPQLRLLVRLAGANGLHRLAALHVLGVVYAAGPEQLCDVPAELRLEGLADLVVLERGDRRFELRRIGARARPAEVAAVDRGTGVLGGGLGEAAEVIALEDAVAQRVRLLLDGGIVGKLVGLHEDMAHVHLVLFGLLRAASHLVEADDVVAGRRAQR